ncbi:MAG: type 1 glutamine amidotransferase [Propionibacteriaceae bacterium]|nr:type 1 glutamine amidotransferase [Propionibacteriaceae bacterium]
MAKRPRVTVLQLDPGCPPARFDGWLREAGLRLTVVPVADHGVPGVDALGEGLVVLGGRMSAQTDDEHPWLGDLRDVIADAHSVELPILGICLGHQVLAETLGGRVVVGHPDGPEEGPALVEWTPAASGDALVGALAATGPITVVESHHDAVTELPPGAVELARTDRFAHQAFRHGSAWGVQFHPEADPDLLGVWSKRSGAELNAFVAAARAVDDKVVASGRALARAFAEIVRD